MLVVYSALTLLGVSLLPFVKQAGEGKTPETFFYSFL